MECKVNKLTITKAQVGLMQLLSKISEFHSGLKTTKTIKLKLVHSHHDNSHHDNMPTATHNIQNAVTDNFLGQMVPRSTVL